MREIECLSAPSLAQIFGWYNQWDFTTFQAGTGPGKNLRGKYAEYPSIGAARERSGRPKASFVMTGECP